MLKDAPFASYLKDMALALRLVLSLRHVGTRLPVQLVVSGERHSRYEELFVAQGVQVSEVKAVEPPAWANPWHAGSFAKLSALSLVGTARVIVLDVDCIVMRNIDHLAFAPTPSLTYRAEARSAGLCTWDINSGVMVLSPSKRAWTRLVSGLLRNATFVPKGDHGDQSIWRYVWAKAPIKRAPLGNCMLNC